MKTEKLYQSKEWLEKKYLNEKLSTYQIAKLSKTSDVNIIRYLRKYDIPRRSFNECRHLRSGNHCQLSSEAIKWLDGELLGDGCLFSQSIYSARFIYASKYLEYIQYVSNTLKSFGIKQSGKINKRYHKNMDCYTYQYSSLTYAELLPIHLKWYPEGKKIVPKDIKLTPLVVRQHYIGDGHLAHPKNSRPYIRLCTNSFSISDVERLITQLIKLGYKAVRQLSNNSIYISTQSTKDFLNYIGKCPVKCYQYKFNY